MMVVKIIGLICIAVASFYLFNKASGSLALNKLNIISYVYYLFMLQSFIGCALINLGFDGHYSLGYLLNREASLEMTTNVIMITSIALPTVIIIIYKVFKFDVQKEYAVFLEKELKKDDSKLIFYLLILVACVQFLLLIKLLYNIGYIPLFQLFNPEEGFDFNLARQINKNDIFVINLYVRNIAVLFGIPVIGYITAAYAFVEKKIGWKILAILYFIASFIVKTYDFAKSPVVFHLFIYLLIYLYAKKSKIKNYVIIVFVGIMAIFLMIAYKLVGFQGSFFDIYNGILGRTFFSQVGTLAYHLELFPGVFEYLNGRSLSGKIFELLGLNAEGQLRSGKLVMDFYDSDAVYDKIAGVMNNYFLVEGYVNWGFCGIAFSFIYV